MEPLKEASGGTTGRLAHRMKFVVVAELAVSLVLLFMSALAARSALRTADFQFGFDTRPLMRASGRFVYRRDLDRFHFTDAASALLPRVESTPGVASATTLAVGTLEHNQLFSDANVAAGAPPMLAGSYVIAGPHFLQTMGIPVREGRDFEPGDDVDGAVILDERAVPLLFSVGDAIGHRVKFGAIDGASAWLRVIGVAKSADLMFPGYPDSPRWPPIYARIARQDPWQWTIIARASGNAPATLGRIDRELNTLLPGSARATVVGYGAYFESNVRFVRFSAAFFAALSVVSLALAAAGLFAVLAYTVSQRRREFGVRVALGAARMNILRLVITDAAQIALAGTAIGAFGGLWVGSTFFTGVYGVVPTDVVSLLAAECVLIAVTLGGALAPAMRATRADPLEVLRSC